MILPRPIELLNTYFFLFYHMLEQKKNSLIIFFIESAKFISWHIFWNLLFSCTYKIPTIFFELETLETSSILWLSTGDSSVTGKCKWKISCKMWQNKNNKSYNLWIIVKDRVSTGIEQAISKLFRIHRKKFKKPAAVSNANSISKALSYLCCV